MDEQHPVSSLRGGVSATVASLVPPIASLRLASSLDADALCTVLRFAPFGRWHDGTPALLVDASAVVSAPEELVAGVALDVAWHTVVIAGAGNCRILAGAFHDAIDLGLVECVVLAQSVGDAWLWLACATGQLERGGRTRS